MEDLAIEEYAVMKLRRILSCEMSRYCGEITSPSIPMPLTITAGLDSAVKWDEIGITIS